MVDVGRYLGDRARGVVEGLDLGAKLRGAMGDPSFDAMLLEKLTEMSTKPEGMLVKEDPAREIIRNKGQCRARRLIWGHCLCVLANLDNR